MPADLLRRVVPRDEPGANLADTFVEGYACAFVHRGDVEAGFVAASDVL